MASQTLTIRRPDDWHVHLRDGEMLQKVAPYTARQFARAIVMPNLVPPITTVKAAREYRKRMWRLIKVRPDPSLAVLYLLKCALHYHQYTMARQMAAGHSPVYNTI